MKHVDALCYNSVSCTKCNYLSNVVQKLNLYDLFHLLLKQAEKYK